MLSFTTAMSGRSIGLSFITTKATHMYATSAPKVSCTCHARKVWRILEFYISGVLKLLLRQEHIVSQGVKLNILKMDILYHLAVY